MTYEEIQLALKDRVIKVVSESTGINQGTIINIKKGKTKRPNAAVLKVLSDYLEPKNQG